MLENSLTLTKTNFTNVFANSNKSTNTNKNNNKKTLTLTFLKNANIVTNNVSVSKKLLLC